MKLIYRRSLVFKLIRNVLKYIINNSLFIIFLKRKNYFKNTLLNIKIFTIILTRDQCVDLLNVDKIDTFLINIILYNDF